MEPLTTQLLAIMVGWGLGQLIALYIMLKWGDQIMDYLDNRYNK